jgi:hypothetical protein
MPIYTNLYQFMLIYIHLHTKNEYSIFIFLYSVYKKIFK